MDLRTTPLVRTCPWGIFMATLSIVGLPRVNGPWSVQGSMFTVPGNRNQVQTGLNNEGRFLAPETGKSRGGVSFRVG